MFHRNLLGVPDPPLLCPSMQFPESSTTSADPRSGWFGRVAEQSSLKVYEAKDLIEITGGTRQSTSLQEKTVSGTDMNSVSPTVVASDTTETIDAGQLTSPLFTQEREVSATPFGVSAFQPAAASIIKCGKSLANV